jgi:hypothetical protein
MSRRTSGLEFLRFRLQSCYLKAAPQQTRCMEVSGSILGTTRFSEYHWVWNGVHSTLVRINEELLGGKISGFGLEN